MFLDSSILVEYVKGNKIDLLDHLLNDTNSSLFISQIVISEFYFHALAAYGNKSPLSLKMSGVSAVSCNNINHNNFYNYSIF